MRIFWERYGEGDRNVVLMPGWPMSPARVWKAQIPYLARHLRVVAFDPRGNGRSDRFEDLASSSPSGFAADTLAVMDAAEMERAVVVTIGPGAQTALILAAEHPDRVEGAVLITPDPWAADQYLDSFGKGDLDTYEGWDKFNPTYWRQDWQGFARWWASTVSAEPHSTRQIEDLTAWIAAADPEAITAYAFEMGLTDREEVLAGARRVRCPVLVIYDDERKIASEDTWTPLAEATGGRLLKIEGANHLGPGRYPVPFNLALRQFVDSTRGAIYA